MKEVKPSIAAKYFLQMYLLELFMKSKQRLNTEEHATFLKLWEKIQGNKNQIILP